MLGISTGDKFFLANGIPSGYPFPHWQPTWLPHFWLPMWIGNRNSGESAALPARPLRQLRQAYKVWIWGRTSHLKPAWERIAVKVSTSAGLWYSMIMVSIFTNTSGAAAESYGQFTAFAIHFQQITVCDSAGLEEVIHTNGIHRTRLTLGLVETASGIIPGCKIKHRHSGLVGYGTGMDADTAGHTDEEILFRLGQIIWKRFEPMDFGSGIYRGGIKREKANIGAHINDDLGPSNIISNPLVNFKNEYSQKYPSVGCSRA